MMRNEMMRNEIDREMKWIPLFGNIWALMQEMINEINFGENENKHQTICSLQIETKQFVILCNKKMNP